MDAVGPSPSSPQSLVKLVYGTIQNDQPAQRKRIAASGDRARLAYSGALHRPMPKPQRPVAAPSLGFFAARLEIHQAGRAKLYLHRTRDAEANIEVNRALRHAEVKIGGRNHYYRGRSYDDAHLYESMRILLCTVVCRRSLASRVSTVSFGERL